MGNSRIVDQEIKWPAQPTHHCEQIVNGVRVAHVTGLRQHPDAKFLQFPARFVERTLVAAGDDQIASFVSQGPRDRQPDAAVGAGNQGEPVLQGI
jgi:hypothetical protein